MKKLLVLLVMVLTLSACGSKSETKDLLTEIKERGNITVASEGNWSPYTYHDEETGELVGFDVELGQLIAEKLGVEFIAQETDWDSILAGVESGRYDLGINGVTYSDERAKSYNFSEPYLYDQTVLIVLEDNNDITSFDDLADRVTTNSPGSSYADMAIEYGATVNYVNTFADTIQVLLRGDAEATINALAVYNDYLREKGDDAGIKIVARTEPEKTVIATKKSDSTNTLVEEINKILNELREDGTLAELSIKYFGYDATVVGE
ncbi:MAG: transporter substrate-binding domain-containing protein [Erysipelotrichaceae bacterium]|nr:transporter substrate-binding domain-containing protein [Erysipelotrichaceae bacterium]